MITEEQAKTKWCPFVRVGSESSGLGSLNRDYRIGIEMPKVKCIASACMAWRAPSYFINDQGIACENPEKLGFCGLAGLAGAA